MLLFRIFFFLLFQIKPWHDTPAHALLQHVLLRLAYLELSSTLDRGHLSYSLVKLALHHVRVFFCANLDQLVHCLNHIGPIHYLSDRQVMRRSHHFVIAATFGDIVERYDCSLFSPYTSLCLFLHRGKLLLFLLFYIILV